MELKDLVQLAGRVVLVVVMCREQLAIAGIPEIQVLLLAVLPLLGEQLVVVAAALVLRAAAALVVLAAAALEAHMLRRMPAVLVYQAPVAKAVGVLRQALVLLALVEPRSRLMEQQDCQLCLWAVARAGELAEQAVVVVVAE